MAASDDNSAAEKGVFDAGGEITRRSREDLGSVQEPAREIPVFATDALREEFGL